MHLNSTTLFASWGVGFRSGGFNNQGSEATVNTFINNLLYDGDSTPPIRTLRFLSGAVRPQHAGCVATGRSPVGISDDYEKETSSAFELGFKSDLPDQ